VIAIEPVKLPVVVGVKVTLIVQVLPAASVPGRVQVSVSAKSPVAAPTEIVVLAVPVFFTVTALLELVVFSACAANVSLAGVTVTVMVPVPPVPVRLTV